MQTRSGALPISGRASEQIDGGDEALVERARRGDHDAFASLVEQRLERIFRTASAILRNEADARDVTQETLVSAWTNLPRLREASRFDAWLHRALVNRCRDALRRRGRVREIQIESLDATVGERDRGDADVAAVNAALDRLSVAQREILVLHHLDGLPVADIAHQLGVPVGTAKWRLHAARTALERALRDNP
jgi:RNA polymerase sigma-70 factor (ECF subfamily)